ncbi:MAG: protealysin inhibitor emfourin [Verrucomicrobiota bacterium]
MHLKLTRTGGFGGITPPPVEVDTATLSKKDAQHIESLVAGAKFFDLPKSFKAAQSQPDRFQFSLQIAHEDGRQHAVTCDEEAASEPLRQLLQAVQTLKRK